MKNLESVSKTFMSFPYPMLKPVAVRRSNRLELLAKTIHLCDRATLDVETFKWLSQVRTQFRQLRITLLLVLDLYAEVGCVDDQAKIGGFKLIARVDERGRPGVVRFVNHR